MQDEDGTGPLLSTSCIPRVRVFRSMRRAFHLVPGTGYQAPGTRHRINAEGRTPMENAHTGYASCIPASPLVGAWE